MSRPKNLKERELSDLAEFLGIEQVEKSALSFSGVCSDSRLVIPGDLFFALPGEKSHGIAFLKSALERGARAVITDSEGAIRASQLSPSTPLLVVPKPRTICGEVSSWFYGQPSNSLFIAGITGTNGKTTTTYLLNQIWQFAQVNSGLIGTIGIKYGTQSLPATHTTPESDELQRLFACMKEAGVRKVAMEVSSHALDQGRVLGTHFKVAGFTNLTQDHLDYHGTISNYFAAKSRLFTYGQSELGIVCIDGDYGQRLWKEMQIPKRSISATGKADWHFERVVRISNGFELLIRGVDGISIANQFNLIGEHNLENLLLAVATAHESGVDPLVIAEALPHLTGAPGRLERIKSDKYLAMVDYAHTPDAVARVLATVRDQGKKVIAVLGCGGDRDSTKRAPMGAALNEGADIPIFTSDNPRSENPEKILAEMTAKLKIKSGGEVIVDRKEAILRAVELADPGDLILVLGKGHETGQEINGVKIPFSDQEILKSAIEARG
jgi:UDP-N-acetylmuramoyl-L-alanyl-D-glutamate--2,6-diaminopimelate ligase